MKKVILGIFALAYLSGVFTLVLGHFLNPESSPSEPQKIPNFIDEVEKYPWVRDAQRQQGGKELQYYGQITCLYSVDNRIGLNLLHAGWLKDSITEEEAGALRLLVALSEEDSEIALSVSQSTWFQKGISSDELALIENILALSEENVHVAKNITSSNWFIITGTHKVNEMISSVMDMPSDLALAVSFAPWFTSDASLSWGESLQELTTLYNQDKNLAVNLPFMCLPEDFDYLQQVNKVYSTDKELAELFFQYNTLSRENFLVFSDLSRIHAYDKGLAYSLVDNLEQDKIQIISSLADIYTFDPAIGKLARENFGDNKCALQYLQKVLEMGVVKPELLKQAALFCSDNPEFVYEDRIEPYRYHLLTEILSEIPSEKAQEYKTLIFVTCSVYGNRFYLWQNAEYSTRNGWAYDECLLDLERDAVITLLNFFIEKNDKGLFVVDLREQSLEYLYGLVDIPFTHFVNCDGTLAEAIPEEQGTGFVFATIANIDTLSQRFEKVKTRLQHTDDVQYTYSNSLVKLILEQGGERDRYFLSFCAKNWEVGACISHALHTRMDSIVVGISTTTMHWTAPETAHMYPAYIPTDSVAEKIQADPDAYGNPFVYKGFTAPYDKAGYRDYVGNDIETVEIYDPQAERKVNIFHREEGIITDKMLVVVVGAVIIFVVAGTLRIVK